MAKCFAKFTSPKSGEVLSIGNHMFMIPLLLIYFYFIYKSFSLVSKSVTVNITKLLRVKIICVISKTVS